jgi:hypothetical protein
MYVLYSTLLHLPPLSLHCFGGCWDRTQDSCDYGIGCQTRAKNVFQIRILVALKSGPHPQPTFDIGSVRWKS